MFGPRRSGRLTGSSPGPPPAAATRPSPHPQVALIDESYGPDLAVDGSRHESDRLGAITSYDGTVDREVWASFTHDPRDRQYQALRASDHDRSVLLQVLADAYADGRLDRGEFDERSDAARTVRTLGDIDPLLNDLVPAKPAPGTSLAGASRTELERLAHRHWQAKRREAVFSFIGASTLTTGIWVATSFRHGGWDPYFFWPVFVIVFSLLHLIRTSGTRQEIVDNEVRRLERRRDKDLRRKSWGR